MTPQFVHLRLHSEYSIVDGLIRINDAVKAAKKDNQGAIAVTDLGNFFGLVKFYKAARKEGVKPIAGCDVWIKGHENDKDVDSRLLLLIKNQKGYTTLCELLSKAWLENQNRTGQAEIPIEWFEPYVQKGDMGLIALSGARDGNIGKALLRGDRKSAQLYAKRWSDLFKDSFYIEIQRTTLPNSETLVQESLDLASELELPIVATHPIQFLNEKDYEAHETRICIASSDTLSNTSRQKLFTQEQFFLTQEEMVKRFEDIPEAIQNTVEIAKRCNLKLKLGTYYLPEFPTPEGMSLDDFMEQQAREGLEERLIALYPDENKRNQERPRYKERLDFEIKTIQEMKFPGYFLIVSDFIKWAKQNGIPVGPGRGSGAGSLVAYSLKITDLDPLKYNLLFERFLNPERVSMPDFDIDFCQEGRDKVIQYVKHRYGSEAVSQIATFGTMAAKAAVKDVGRALSYGYTFCDQLSKLIPFKPGKQVTIADAKNEEPELREREEKDEDVKQLLGLAEQVEGLTRNVGMHAGGVLIAPSKLTDFCPLYTQNQGDETGIVSQFDKKDVEEIGLVKFDFLGLTTLTILDLAVRYIHQVDPTASDFSLDKIPLDDRATFDLLTNARTVAVFQLESRGMQGMLKDAKPDRFEDIIALVALYRPGPMDLIPDYCRRKHGEAFDYPDPRTESILSETYGIMVYQEQVMQMAQILGGYSLGGADLLRRAMGKKDADEMARQRQTFREGAAKNGLSEEKADEIFDLMEKFAGYGFNKSHATAYALLAYQTAYLKEHYPSSFMAANMSLAMDDGDKIRTLISDAVDVCSIEILPPDINLSEYRFVPVAAKENQSNPSIRFGLGALRGSGENAVAAVVRARKEGGPFKDLFDFCMRVERHYISRRTIEAFIRSGTFDCFGEDRATLMNSLSLAIEAAEQAHQTSHQGSLFGGDEPVLESVSYLQASAWSLKRKLKEEKEILGLCLSGHFFDQYRDEAKAFGCTSLDRISVSQTPKWLAGVISNVREQTTAKGSKLAIVTIDDGKGSQEITIYSELLAAKRSALEVDECLFVTGKISNDTFRGGLRVSADDVLTIEEARIFFKKSLQCSLSHRPNIQKIKEVLAPFVTEKGLPLLVSYRNDHATCEIQLGENWKLLPSDDCLKAIHEISCH